MWEVGLEILILRPVRMVQITVVLVVWWHTDPIHIHTREIR